MNNDLMSIKADRPNIITTEIETISFYRKMDTKATVEKMIEGKLCKDDESKFYMVEALLEGDASNH